ncbi:hypothetical protein [Streptomyces sp. VRA16 Mangrove soil]|uniref:hypothetical protein n=1 Tax=Streptomyces sp. VRA16 Mangrove soil TaxID=2817434 RepID=UPI001A9EF148|nr:hypothetical protein [Streptomyces sp. VRA16 Mangrove soil]MBO1333554.1 hypothetical protein [Streptomyces sp. VRA16 Mangrove soil]
MRTALRKKTANSALAVAAVAALAFSLTACNDGDGTQDSGAAASSSASATGSPSSDAGASASAAADGSGNGGSGSGDGSGATGGSGSGGSDDVTNADSGGAGDDSGAHGECVNTGTEGCWTGTLTYLADHKMMVGDQAFDVDDSTQIRGAAAICGSSDGSVTAENNVGTTPCTYDQLVKAAKMSSVKVRVLKGGDGLATSVREIYHP